MHTGRQIDGQDRLGMGIIDTATKELLPWRSQLWDDNLARVGGVTRIVAGDIAPDDSYFVVGSGSGGDAPPISDTVIAYPLDTAALQNSDVEPLWISRHFDSIYSLAVTEVAVYAGGHFGFIESPTSDDPWPGLTNVGYGTGQGLAGYGLGDQVVRRDHIAALNPADGKSLEWNPTDGSNSFEGDKAMEATPRGLFIGGDGMFKGGVRTGRVGFFDFNTVPYPVPAPDTTITAPIEGRVVRQQHRVRDHRHRAGRHRHRRPGPGADPGPRQQPVPPGQRHGVHHVRQHRQHAQRHPRPGHRHHPHLADHRPGDQHHHQPQPAGLGAGVHRGHRRHGRHHQGDEEVRVLRHRRTRRRPPASPGRPASRPRPPSR